jgi:hypothetical protein
MKAAGLLQKSGGDLLSQEISLQVPSAQTGLTSVFGMGTGVTLSLSPPKTHRVTPAEIGCIRNLNLSIANTSRKIQALGRLVPVSSNPHGPYTSGLSTWSSGHGPYQVNPVGDLILRRASHLDAFSAYPFRRWQTSHALGRTTGTLELRPTRSSRTRVSFSQISCDYGG